MRVIDFMPPRGEAPDIVRIVEGLDGTVPMRSDLAIRFDYGDVVPWVRQVDGALRGRRRAGRALLPHARRGARRGDDVGLGVHPPAGRAVPFVLTWFPSHKPLPAVIDPEQALADAEEYWLDWADHCSHHGDYHDEIHQSLLVLKALTYGPTGGIVAAPTTSLPGAHRRPRNWDYRFCWLRDATLTLVAMLNAGYLDEAIKAIR